MTLGRESLSPELRKAIRQHRSIFVQVAMIGFGLGAVAMLCLVGIVNDGVLRTASEAPWFAVYRFAAAAYLLSCGVTFHMCEFLVAAWCRPHDTHPRAFMLYHSAAYTIAQVAAVVEFVVETWLVPESWKLITLSRTSVSVFFAAVMVFYGVRVVAMWTCGENFSLEIEEEHRDDHQLVTNGIFSYLRHPSYFGWFWRTVFSQLLLMNPVCLVGFTVVTWRFFKQRIPVEESILSSESFFGEKYIAYRKATPTGIPFIA